MNIIVKHTKWINRIFKFSERIVRHFQGIKIIFVVILIFSINLLYAQPGNIFLKNYNPSINNIDNVNNSIVQGHNGIMYFANPSGILSYDGKIWNLISIPSIPLVLSTNPDNNRIYVGCKKDFGYFDYDETGKELYTSISKDYSNFENISKILITKTCIYFYCTKQIFCYSIASGNLKQVLPPAWNDRFSGLFQNNGVVYVNISGKGLHHIKGNKLWKINAELAEQSIIAAISLSTTSTLIYTDQNNVYIFNGFKLILFKLEDLNYLKENTVITGIELSNNLFVLATLSGGCVIINKQTGKTNSIINYQTGLPDNEIQAVATDNLGGLWIAHNYGVTRADNQLPITSFSSYPGLKGNLTDVIKINEKLYVATSEGVFVLSQIFSEEQITATKNKKIIKKVRECKIDSSQFPKEIKVEPLATVTEIKEEPRSNNIFKKLAGVFKKKSNQQKVVVPVIEAKLPEKQKEVTYTVSTAKLAKIKPLIYNSSSLSNSYNPSSFEYGFKKINGIDKKCNQLLYYNGKLFAATINDLFEIENGSAKAVIRDKHINTIYLPIKLPNQIYIGTDEGILIYHTETEKFEDIDLGVNVSSIVEDKHNNLWIGGVNQVIKFEKNKFGELSRQITYPLSAHYSDYVKVRNVDDNLWFISGFDVYHYNDKKDIVYKDITIKLNPNTDKIIYAKNEQLIWIYKDLFWNCYTNECKKNNTKIIALSIINNIRQIYVDNEKNCWVINDDNILYRVTRNRIENHHNKYLFIKEARNGSGTMLPIQDIILEHNNSSIRFMITNPYFINEKANQYQYILEGAMNKWSSWSNNKTIDFPFLPYGNFKLYVRAKNVFGEITEHNGISFSVAYPYWLSWWFYLIEIGGVFLLLSLSIYFNKSKKASYLSKSLLLLSIVIIFKLIQASIESSISISPVFDFSVSVTMVFVIMSVEKIIMKKLTNNTRMIKTRIIWKNRRLSDKIRKQNNEKELSNT